MATYAQFKHVELYKIGHGKNRVPNAPKSSIAEIFSADTRDAGTVSNGVSRPRLIRDSPSRPRDTHSRLFGQSNTLPLQPMVTDTIRSHIQFGENPTSNNSSAFPVKMNGSACSSRGEPDNAEHSSVINQPKRNPVTGDGMPYVPPRRRHPAASMRGADHDILEPQPTHRYITSQPHPSPTNYYVHSTTKPATQFPQTPYTLIGLDNAEDNHHISSDNENSNPLYELDRDCPPFPAQYHYEPQLKIPNHPLPPYSSIALRSRFGERPELNFKRYPVATLDGPIDPYLLENCDPAPTLFKYERDGPIPDLTLIQTPKAPGPFTLTGFPPIFPKHVPGYLFNINRHSENLGPKTYYLDYVRSREMEGNPITGDYKSMNGQINTVTSVAGTGYSSVRPPPGGFTSSLW